MTTTDYAERSTRTKAVLQLFLEHPGTWLYPDTLAHVGGFCAWRTRVSDARHIIERDGLGQIEWNGKARASAYRFVQVVPVQPPVEQIALFR